MPLSYFAARRHVEAIFGLRPLVGPNKWFLGLLGSMNPLEEINYLGYSRVEIAPEDWLLHPEEPLVYNRNNIVFPQALENWNNIVGWGLWDREGNLWYYESLQEPVNIPAGSRARVQAGAIIIRYMDTWDNTLLGTEKTFEISVVPNFLIGIPGQSYSIPIVITRRFGHQNAITFTYSGPGGWFISVDPAIASGFYAHLHIQIPLGTNPGHYEVALHAYDGTTRKETTVKIVIP